MPAMAVTAISFLLAAGSFFTGATAVASSGNVPLSIVSRAVGRTPDMRDRYTLYSGPATAGWPSMDKWIPDFETMFKNNRHILKQGCSQFGVPLNSKAEIDAIHDTVLDNEADTGVDARYIFAVLLEESAGCVRAPTTNYGVRNPGLMQSHNGQHSCNDGGKVQVPCPRDTIRAMIHDGAGGTPYGDGLQQLMAKAPGSGHERFYNAARMYNSGSIHHSGNLEDGIATHCYVTDIANRLTGWARSQKGCHYDGGPPPAYGWSESESDSDSETGSSRGRFSGSDSDSDSGRPNRPAAPPKAVRPPVPTVARPAQPVTQPAVPALKPTPLAKSKNRAVASDMRGPGSVANCARWYRVQPNDFCVRVAQKVGITFDSFMALNPGLDKACGNLWKGYDYCVEGV